MEPLKDMTGLRIGRLTVVARAQNGEHGRARWFCRCDCGGETIQYGKNLRKQIVRSCGCLRRETSTAIGRRSRKHGHAILETPEYRALRNAVDRCSNPRHREYHRYGGRGIEVCPEWRADFAAFLANIGPRPSAAHSLDRIDNDGHYEPGNVRWATRREQSNNIRSNHIVRVDGMDKTLAEAIRSSGLKSSTVRARIRNGWSLERALNERERKRTRKKR
jgi:hypothetical protein